jgi:hypothetical protein
MKISLFLPFLICLAACSPQKLTLRYLGQRYSKTQNKSFVNSELVFLREKDTIRMNLKIPYNSVASDTINTGIYRRCFLKIGSVYTFKLKPTAERDIPEALNSYYKINAVFMGKRKGAPFSEVEKDTEFMQRNPGSFIDIDHRVYEIVELLPDKDCAYE